MTQSDASLKENVRPLPLTDEIFNLEPVEYTLKGGSRLQYGFIAQQVEDTGFSHLVYKNKEGIRSIAYTQLIPVLVNHIQHLTARLQALEIEMANNP